MSFRITASPHHHSQAKTPVLMRKVALACLPGIALQWYFFGAGILVQLLLAVVTAWASEAGILALRGKPVKARLMDHSALLTGVLLAVAIPSLAPWWVIVTGVAFAIIIVKQLYGGLGNNLFNPAMAAYVMLLISFPTQMTSWVPPVSLQAHPISASDAVCTIFTDRNCQGLTLTDLRSDVDGRTMATALDTARTAVAAKKTQHEAQQSPVFDSLGGTGWSWVNLGFLLGGLWLLQQRVIQWRIPVAVLVSMSLVSLLFYSIDADRFASPLFHWFTGGTMLAAFFFATDPVSASTTPKGRLIYGAFIGAMAVVIRNVGGYPDGWAFSIMLANITVPLIDAYTKPRTYGHQAKRSA